jgi:hypothetical protein
MIPAVFFMGAGASAEFGIPTMKAMTKEFGDWLAKEHSEHLPLLRSIESRLRDFADYDIEALITVLQDIIHLDRIEAKTLGNPTVRYALGEGTGLADKVRQEMEGAKGSLEAARDLLRVAKMFVVESCQISKEPPPFDTYTEFFDRASKKEPIHKNFRSTVGAAPPNKQLALDIFTTNYDVVLESYWTEQAGFEVNCGEKGGRTLDIDSPTSSLYNADRPPVKILKLHGSINWYIDSRGVLRWQDSPARPGDKALYGHEVQEGLLIYPASEKYTYREPFYEMFHYLKRRLTECRSCYVVGYSFRDEEMLGIFHDSMEKNKELTIWLIDRAARKLLEEKFRQFRDRVVPLEARFTAADMRNRYQIPFPRGDGVWEW